MNRDAHTHPARSLILNVDDSEGARYAKSRTLQRAGFEVIEAECGSEALRLAAERKPDLVLLDIKLPDINGFEVCRRLKTDPKTHPILILQTSASYIASRDKIRALEGGADNYLFEPIEPEELVANVKALLRLGQAERDLREANRRKDIFLATLAHELRNPLAPILTAVELLRRAPHDPDHNRRAQEIIYRQTLHLVRLVDELLDVSRIANDKIELKCERFSLQSLFGIALETASPLIAERGHVLEVRPPPEDLWLHGDIVRLAQVLGNLLRNAAKFTPRDGAIILSGARQGDRVVVRVEDNGIGIAKEDLESIFEEFIQGEHAPDRAKEGLGLGLAISRRLVELHGGQLEASSDGEGRGSAFELWLPAAAAPLSAPQPPRQEVSPVGGQKRILIVDDNVGAAETLSMLLEYQGHVIERAYTGREALEKVRGFGPDVVVIDIGLPDISGHEVARELRARADGGPMPMLVALTGYGRPEDRERALQAGFDVHLTKPVSFDTLQQVLG